MKLACIVFLKATEALQPIPTHIEALLKERVEHSFAQTHPGRTLRFDETNCAHQGEYAFGLDRLRLTAATPEWDGTWTGSLSDILDGKPLDFTGVVVDAKIPGSTRLPTMRKPWEKPVMGMVLGGTAGALAGYALLPNRPSRPTNAIVFGALGALTGTLISFTF